MPPLPFFKPQLSQSSQMENIFIIAIVYFILLAIYLIVFRKLPLKQRLLALYPPIVQAVWFLFGYAIDTRNAAELFGITTLWRALLQVLLFHAASFVGAYCYRKGWQQTALVLLFIIFSVACVLVMSSFDS